MTRVYFIRHAEPNFQNHDDLTRELTEKGLRDRALVTRYLADKSIAAVCSSPYRRAVDTVRPFAEGAGLALRLIPDFRERKVGDDWVEDFFTFAKRQWDDFDYALPQGESLRQVQIRCMAALRPLIAEYAGQSIAVGCHGTALCTVLNYYDPTFGYNGFRDMVNRMPWAVCISLDAAGRAVIETTDLFRNTERSESV